MRLTFSNSWMAFLYTICTNLNELTLNEYAELGASVQYVFDSRFQCFSKEYLSEGSIQMHKERMGCDEEIKEPEAYHQFDHVRYKKCFCNYYDPEIVKLLKISETFDKTGSIKASYLKNDVMSIKMSRYCSIIKQYKLEWEAEEIRKQNEQAKMKARSKKR